MIQPFYPLKSKRLLFVFSLFLGLSTAFAQTTIVSGTTLRVEPGTSFIEASGLGMTSSGTIDNQGTINLKGNFTNNGAATLGTGTFVFNGTGNQTISGTNTMQNVTVNNAAGVTMAGETTINGVLTLTSGLVTLGSNNLTLGTAATVAGTPSASAMVVATGTGELRKKFDASHMSFIYPVGDNDATNGPSYSYASLAFNSGTFATDAYAGINLRNVKYPDVNITGDYLNRYWNVSQTGISAFNCDALFKFYTVDVIGSTANIYAVKIAPAPLVTYNLSDQDGKTLTANGLTSFSTFTGMRAAMTTGLTAFLEGPYNAGSMTTNLRTAGLIPLTQPYNTAPWNYTGTETVGSIPAGVVDWVLVELRQAATAATANNASVFARKAAFLKSDGSIVDVDGVTPLNIYNAAITGVNNLYPVIRHRNHMAIMANNPSTKDATGKFVYNYVSGDGTQIYGSGKKNLAANIWGEVAGDGDQDMQIQNSDFTIWAGSAGGSNVYQRGDYDLDGQLQNSDFTKWAGNAGKSGNIPQ